MIVFEKKYFYKKCVKKKTMNVDMFDCFYIHFKIKKI